MKATAKAKRARSLLSDMLDHLAVVEARAKNTGKPACSLDEVRAKLGLSSASSSKTTR